MDALILSAGLGIATMLGGTSRASFLSGLLMFAGSGVLLTNQVALFIAQVA